MHNVTICGVEVELPDVDDDEVVTDVLVIAQSSRLDTEDWDAGGIIRGSSRTSWATRIGLLRLALMFELATDD